MEYKVEGQSGDDSMQTVTIMETPSYRLNSHGNGWAYTLFHKLAVITPAPTSPDDPAETW